VSDTEANLEEKPTVSVSVKLSNGSLVATTPSGKDLPLSFDMKGLLLLKQLCEWDQRQSVRCATKSEVTSSYNPLDYSRVCHCGKVVEPFMERCDGCPGHDGAGKIPAVKKYNAKGQRQASLSDLGWDLNAILKE
jgi:hypothetical protein